MSEGDAEDRAHETAEDVARRSYGKLVALLASRSRDIAAAEDALADAFATALERWPGGGVPDNPEAWLLTVARRKLIDGARRRQVRRDAAEPLRLLAEQTERDPAAGAEPDERVPLMFACAHPAIDLRLRAPLILQTVLGFDAGAIGSAFLVSPATMGQRLVRAKRKIREAGIPFRIPAAHELASRLAAVLDALYATFAEGWSDPEGSDPRRRELAAEAIWLTRLVVARLPDEPEAWGLLALMLHAQARRPARRDARGDYVPLAEQDPALWDGALIAEAEAALSRASRLPGSGRLQLEAAVQSAHAARRHPERDGRSDWPAIAALYDALLECTGSPVVAVNRAVARAECRGPEAGLAALDEIAPRATLEGYQPYWAARADLLARVGRPTEADEAYRRALGLERDPALRAFLERRRAALTADRAQPEVRS